MIGNKKYYQEIGQVLFNSVPQGAKKLFMKCSLVISDQGDVATFEFDYIDEKGNKRWFPFDSKVDTNKLRRLLTKLRKFFIDENSEVWNKCEYVMDIASRWKEICTIL